MDSKKYWMVLGVPRTVRKFPPTSRIAGKRAYLPGQNWPKCSSVSGRRRRCRLRRRPVMRRLSVRVGEPQQGRLAVRPTEERDADRKVVARETPTAPSSTSLRLASSASKRWLQRVWSTIPGRASPSWHRKTPGIQTVKVVYEYEAATKDEVKDLSPNQLRVWRNG
jgi:hypothetical protein